MNTRILCVDDDPGTLAIVKGLDGYAVHPHVRIKVETEQGAEQALAAVANRGPYAVILSDMEMPGMNGVQFLSWVRQIAPDSIRMMFTGSSALQVAIDAVNEGNIFRFLSKPVPIEMLVKILLAGVEQFRLVSAEKELLEKTLAGSIKALTEILALADPIAFGRALRVRPLVQKVAAELQADNLWQFEVAAMLSQVACITIPDAILRQVYRGDTLSPEDTKVFEAHPQVGQRLIANIPRMEAVAEIVAYHEKRFDGAGPPADNRAGTDIPLAARVLKAVLDFDKLDTKGLSKTAAMDCLRQRIGWYDPAILDVLHAALQLEPQMVLKEMSVQELQDKLKLLDQAELKLHAVNPQDIIGRMILAENIWLPNQQLALSKGHEVTPVILRRLGDLARRNVIPKSVSVWAPAARTG